MGGLRSAKRRVGGTRPKPAQGTRVFASTGHRWSKVLAENCRAGIAVHRSHSGSETSLAQLLHPDFLQAMGAAKFEHYQASPLGKTMLGVPFRSKMEANWARYLEALRTGVLSTDITVLNWLHEPARFWFPGVRRGVTHYAPDFLVLCKGRPPTFVEVKGWMDKASEVALRRFKRHYPDLVLELVTAAEYRPVARRLGPTIPGWEA